MSRPDQRRLPLLVGLMAVLALLGSVLVGGSPLGGAPSGAVVAEDTASPVAAAAAQAGPRAPEADADALGRSGDRLVVAPVSRDPRRPLAHAPVLLVVLAVGLAASAGVPSFIVTAATQGVPRAPGAPVRRRGPPAPAVV